MNQTDDIPVLTDIIKPGDPDMARHFDAHFFDDDTVDVTPDITVLSADESEVIVEAEAVQEETTTCATLSVNIEQLVSDTLDEMLPEFKQLLLSRIQQKLSQDNY